MARVRVGLFSIILICLLGGSLVGALSATKLSSNLIYSWWTHPLAVQVEGNTYFAGVTSNGSWRIFKKTGSSVSYATLGQASPDDHDAPSILAAAGKDTLVFYTRHDKQTYISYRRANAGSLNFGAEQHINFPSSVAYSNILSYHDTIVVFTRSGAGGWRYVFSNDYGETWSTAHGFFTSSTGRVYINFQQFESDPRFVHLAVAYNPDNPHPHFIAYGRLNLATGDVSNSSGSVAKLYSAENLPLTKDLLDDLKVIQKDSHKIRLLDVGDKYGIPVVYYAKWGGGIRSRYYQAVLRGGVWERSFTGIYTGRSFGGPSEANYIGGVALDRNDNNWLYVSAESSGKWTIKRYGIQSDLSLGAGATLASSTTKPLVRPYAVHGGDTVLYQQLNSYLHYTNYQASVFSQ